MKSRPNHLSLVSNNSLTSGPADLSRGQEEDGFAYYQALAGQQRAKEEAAMYEGIRQIDSHPDPAFGIPESYHDVGEVVIKGATRADKIGL